MDLLQQLQREFRAFRKHAEDRIQTLERSLRLVSPPPLVDQPETPATATDGATGVADITGATGATETTGASGPAVTTGATGAAADAGATGATGATGPVDPIADAKGKAKA
jgi:hypothetical protein